MGFLTKILNKKNSKFLQSDNKGTFHNRVEQATEYWIERKDSKKFDPFLLYKFNDETDAVRALLEISCIKIAEDSEELICTLPFIYGYYSTGGDDFEAVLCGSGMSEELFDEAKNAFLKNTGTLINEKRPVQKSKKEVKKKIEKTVPVEKEETDEKTIKVQKASDDIKPEAEFISEERKLKNGKEMRIMMYKAESAKNAIAFLETKLVLKPNMFIIVKTPQGILGRSYEGIYKVRKKQ